MIKENNILKAESGKYLLYKDTPHQSITIGLQYVFDGKNVNLVSISEEEVLEVFPVVIWDNVYYVTSANYSDLVTELIRLKYSLDLELALYANSRIKDTSKEETDFLNWRKVCKETAKKIYNE